MASLKRLEVRENNVELRYVHVGDLITRRRVGFVKAAARRMENEAGSGDASVQVAAKFRLTNQKSRRRRPDLLTTSP